MAEYYNVTTNVGDAEIAKAIANNTKLNITHIAFGDGNGSVPTPSKARTTLFKEVHRQAVTKYERHPTIENWIIIETIIPSNIGGFWVREIGVIADGKLISHGSHAPFEKVADPDGVSEYRLKFTQDIRDGNVVSITLDQSLIYATQAWVEENYIGFGDAGLASRLVAELSITDIAGKKPSEIYAYLQSKNPLSGDKTYYFCNTGSTGSNGFPDSYGTLRGYHVADNTYSYCWQIFTAVNGRDQYVRSPTSASTWSEWRKYFYHGEYGIGTERNSVTDISTKNSAATKGSIWSQLENGTIYSGLTLPYSSDWVTQIRSDMASKNTSIRYFIGGSTWSEWEKIYTNKDVIPISNGGTGSTTASNARVNLGLGNAAVTDVGVSSGNVLGVGSAGLATRLVAELSITDIASKKPSEIYAYLQSKNPLSGDKTYYFCNNGSTGSNGFPDSYGTLRGYHVSDNTYSYCWQIFTAVNGRDQYVRSPTGASTWSEWNKLITANDIDPSQYSPIAYPSASVPSGYLAMLGQTISQSIYPKLYALYGGTLPDMRGYFIRGWDNGRGIDSGRMIRSYQADAIRNISGSIAIGDAVTYVNGFIESLSYGVFSSEPFPTADQKGISSTTIKSLDRTNRLMFNAANVVPTASENRPYNIAFQYIVKAG